MFDLTLAIISLGCLLNDQKTSFASCVKDGFMLLFPLSEPRLAGSFPYSTWLLLRFHPVPYLPNGMEWLSCGKEADQHAMLLAEGNRQFVDRL